MRRDRIKTYGWMFAAFVLTQLLFGFGGWLAAFTLGMLYRELFVKDLP